MKLHALLILAVSTLGFVGCNTVTPKEACETQAKAECQKMWGCSGSVLKIGSDEASCVTQLSSLACGLIEEGKCPEGQAYSVSDVLKCADETEKATCEQYLNGIDTSACKAAACD